MKPLSAICLVMALAACVCGADTTFVDTAAVVDTAVSLDSTANAPPRAMDTVVFVPKAEPSIAGQVTNPVDYEQHLTQKPTAALFKSMLVPGWGQIGNRRYVKAGVFIALEAWFIGAIAHYDGQASDFRDRYDSAVDIDNRSDYYDLWQDRRSERNKYAWFAGLTVFLSMFDAYVDAHLSGDPDEVGRRAISVDVAPDDQGGAKLNLTIAF